MSSEEAILDLNGSSSRRRRGSAPKAGSVWEGRMKLDEIKGGFKVFNPTENTQITSNLNNNQMDRRVIDAISPKQSPIEMNAKRKTWRSENSEGGPLQIATRRSELTNESSVRIKKNAIQFRKLKSGSTRATNDGEIEVKSGSTEAANGGEIDKEITVVSKEVVIEDDKRLLHKNERSVLVSTIVEEEHPPVVDDYGRTHLSPAKTKLISDDFHGIPRSRTNSRLQSFVDLVMWNDVSKSAFVFGVGTFGIISSSYTNDLNISFISMMSYLGLVFLAAIFLLRSLINRGSMDMYSGANQDCVVGEEEAIWVVKSLLPHLNEFLLKVRALFSGDPATTMKLAGLLFILARCGSSITIWKMAKLGFLGVFIVPKICSKYSSNGTFWIRRFGNAWESCPHKKAVAFAIFTLVWNSSSIVARIWAVFMLLVAFKYYYHESLIREGWANESKATNIKGQMVGSKSKLNETRK